MSANYNKFYEKDYETLMKKYSDKTKDYDLLKYDYQLLKSKLKTKEKQIKEIEEKVTEEYEIKLNEKEKIINEKDLEIARLKALLNNDGTSCGIPTSQTPLNKKKIIPNCREKSNKKIGGQQGHKQSKLRKFDDDEINDVVIHTVEKCPYCSSNLEEVGETYKDELSYKFLVIKRRNVFKKYKCSCCNREIHQNIPNNLKEENQYGSEIKSIVLSLANTGNVPINKIRKLIKGLSNNEIDISEGFISKLQKQASNKLEGFKRDLYKKLIKLKLMYWDDTVIMVDTNRACLRFYGDEKIAYYTAHEHKNEEGITKDAVLNTLGKDVTVMHDHNKINYKYDYNNIECNIHLIRDLEKCKNNTCHKWCEEFKYLIQKNIHEKNELLKKDHECKNFPDEYLSDFEMKYEEIIQKGITENLENSKTHYDKEEKALLKRILEFKCNYFLWLYNFDLPSDDNLSERSLRGIKSKLKVSGQFQNINYAEYYANIKTYIETCYRNRINSTEALTRLMQDNPFTIDEIFGIEKEDESN